MAAPAKNENTMEPSRAGQMPRPWSVSHHVTNVENSAISPCAKFNSPVVR